MKDLPSRLLVEICVEGIASALAAEQGGADRIELCENLAVGGVTPSAGQIAVVCRRLAIPVHVLIRPRAGDFVYSPAEVEAMEHDIDVAKSLGTSGVVLGVLDASGHVDRETTVRLVNRARPLSVTFHKAFDAVNDPFAALETLIDLGVDRVLTSGGAATALEGLDRLAALNRQAAGRIVVMAGGRITEDQIPRIAAAAIPEIHLGSAACSATGTDPERVRRIGARARGCSPGTEKR